MTLSRRQKLALGLGCVVAVLLLVFLSVGRGTALRDNSSHPLLRDQHDYVGAETCASCHGEQHQSWSHTYHSTMTQLPSRHTVLGAFDGAPVTLYGATATPFERHGRYYFRLPAPSGGHEREAEVALCVGSRRYQQYFERHQGTDGVTYRRLPLLWHIGEQRWMHLNGIFLEADNNDWSAHDAVWNANCVFCHNTGVAPGLRVVEEPGAMAAGRGIKRFDSHVADLGIACEACHGPGRRHVEANDSLRARYLGGGSSAHIVHPEALAQAESAALCGQCHSQRLPDPPEKIWTYLDQGPGFRPGQTLQGHVTPVTRDTQSLDPNAPNLFRARFWADGTPRLTAYEYLGLTQSPCFSGGKFTCTSCHSMHAGDPRGQLEEPMRGNAACSQCHQSIAHDISAHTHHAPASPGSQCMDCHMPRIVYGVLTLHRSHRIESPDVARDVREQRPNACALCHVERSALWVHDKLNAWWGPKKFEPPAPRPDGVPLDAPWALVGAHGGDPVERAVYQHALGRPGVAASDELRVVILGNALIGLGDAYGAVRYQAHNSAKHLDQRLKFGLSELAAFDVQGPPAERHRQLLRLLGRYREQAPARFGTALPGLLFGGDFELDRAKLGPLFQRQSRQAISIGE